ncbi:MULTISPECIES: phage tail tape measure protein [Pantoea]|nr:MULTISPECIES: phage tail tape measure protein [Pantoea]
MDSFELKAIITAVDKLTGPLQGMQRQVKGFKKEMASLSKIASTAGFGIAGMFAVPIHEAIEFDEKMSEVRKVVEGMDDQKAFAKMGRDILDLSSSIPMSADGIAEIVAAAGQAGVAHTELKQFATDAAKTGVAFGMSAEDAGQAMTAWRAAFKMPQADIERLSDQVSYLGRHGKATGAQIASVVTDVSSIAKAAHVSAEDLAALAATTMGVGVQSDVAATGIKNFFKALTSSNSGNAKKVFHAIHMNPSQVANGMVKDARGTMVKVLEGINKLPEAKKAKALTLLFGSESSAAITPLLNNLDKLKEYFSDVSDAQKYTGSTQKEFEAVTKNTQSQLKILSNNLNIVGVDVGSTFLPAINDAVKDMVPLIQQFDEFVQKNPETISQIANLSKSLIGTGLALGAVSKASKILNNVMDLSPAKLAIAALVGGAYLIIDNWDQVGPVIREVWGDIDGVAQALGGWESVAGGVSLYMGGKFALNTVGTLKDALSVATKLQGVLSKIGGLGATTIYIAVAIEMFNQLKEIEEAVKQKDGTDSFWTSLKNRMHGGWYQNEVNIANKQGRPVDNIYDYKPLVPLDRAVSPTKQQTELKVTFDNAPPGMRVLDNPKAGDPYMRVTSDVGYSPFRKPQ